MVLPLGDDNSDRIRTPFVNYAFIAANVLVFVLLQGLGTNLGFTYSFSTVPQEIMSGRDLVTEGEVVLDPVSGDPLRLPGLGPTPISVYLTLLTSMFMHGGLGHLFGNMLYLWIFGDNLENVLGHVRYLLFYLLCGILAGLAHVFATAGLGGDMTVPSLGASGAISGVQGGYILLFPHRRVRVMIWYRVTEVPAVFVIGLWFFFQLVSGMGMLGAGAQRGGVAYAAHIGGFLAGFLLIKLLSPRVPPDARFPRHRPA